MGHSWKVSVLTNLHFSSSRVLMKKYCPLQLVHNFLDQMLFLHFPNNVCILKVNAQLSSGGRQPSEGQTSKYHCVQTQGEPSCITSYRSYIDSTGMMQLKPEFKITWQFSVNASSLKTFQILKLGRQAISWCQWSLAKVSLVSPCP